MKKLKKIFIGCLLLVFLIGGNVFTSRAREVTETLMELSEPADMVAWIFYEEQEPEVVVTGPDGTEYSEKLGNVQVKRGESSVYLYIPDAQPGRWTIRYDNQNSGNVRFVCSPYTESISISSFTMEQAQNNQIRAVFQADFPSQVNYSYEISAVLTDGNGNTTGKRQLETGTAPSGQPVERLISLNRLPAYEGYRLQLEVWYKKYDLETGDSKIADGTFSAEAGHQPEAMKGVQVEIDFDKKLVYLDWEEYRVSCDHYVAAVRDSAGPEEEPDEYREVENGEYQMTAGLPENASSITVELTYVQTDGNASETYRREIPLNQMECSLRTPENTASAQAEISYRTQKQILARIQINDRVQSLNLEGEGQFSTALEEGRNQLVLTAEVDEMTDFVYRFQVYSDRIAPILRLYEDIDGITVDSAKFLLTGETESGCRLMVNGQEQPLGEDGVFRVELSLKNGENTIEIQATDPSGNQTRQQAVLFRGTPEEAKETVSGAAVIAGGYGPLLLTAWLSVMAALLALIGFMAAGNREKRGSFDTALATARNLFLFMAAAAGAAFGWFFLQAHEARDAVSGEAFLEAAQASVSQAYDLVKAAEKYEKWLLLMGALTVLLLIWAVMVQILKMTTKKRILALMIQLFLIGAGILAVYWFYGVLFW